MAKRRRTNNTLTGGTKDVNPQYIHGLLRQVLADQTYSSQFVLPVARFASTANQAVVIEVLKVFTEFTLFPPAVAAQHIMTMSAYFTTQFHGLVDIQAEAADCFAWAKETYSSAFTVAGYFLFYLVY